MIYDHLQNTRSITSDEIYRYFASISFWFTVYQLGHTHIRYS